MENCPTCGEILYSVNSSSNEMECLSKACSYSTISRVGIEFFSFVDESPESWSVCAPEEAKTLLKPDPTPQAQRLF